MVNFSQKVKLRQQTQKKLKKPAKWLTPDQLERKYKRLLRQLVREISKAIRDMLIPMIPTLINEVESLYPKNDEKINISQKNDDNYIKNTHISNIYRKDDFLDTLNGIILSIGEFIEPKVKETITEMETIGNEINVFNEQQFQKVNRSVFGIDIFVDQPWLTSQLELFSEQNAELITSIPEQDLFQVEGIVQRGLQEGQRFTKMAQEIQKRFGITRRRANLIARDQTAKLNSSLTKLRQQSAGIESYQWQTAGDERVRPTHRANDGKIFKWANPPKKTGHPGTDVNCRCVAIPIMEDIIE